MKKISAIVLLSIILSACGCSDEYSIEQNIRGGYATTDIALETWINHNGDPIKLYLAHITMETSDSIKCIKLHEAEEMVNKLKRIEGCNY